MTYLQISLRQVYMENLSVKVDHLNKFDHIFRDEIRVTSILIFLYSYKMHHIRHILIL